MRCQTERSTVAANDNDDDDKRRSEALRRSPAPRGSQAPCASQSTSDSSPLVDTLRSAALGQLHAARQGKSARLAFDTSIALETRLRVIAEISSQETEATRAGLGRKGAMTLLPIAVGILAVMVLGSMLAQKLTSPPIAAPSHIDSK